jgi:hypothetical protein
MAEAASRPRKASTSIALFFTDYFINKRLTLSIAADGSLLSPVQQRAVVQRPLKLIEAALWFFPRPSAGNKRGRDAAPLPLGYTRAEYSPVTLTRVVIGVFATTCQRFASAPGSMNVSARKTSLWGQCVMHRVLRGYVRRVQVRIVYVAL